MVINHTDNSALYLYAVDRLKNKPLTDKMHECFGLLQQIQNKDVSGKLYLAICDAVDIAEDYAFDAGAELQSAITADELAKHDNAAAWECYGDFMESNLCGVSFKIES